MGSLRKISGHGRRSCFVPGLLPVGGPLFTGLALAAWLSATAAEKPKSEELDHLQTLNRAFYAAYQKASPAVAMITTKNGRSIRRWVPSFHPPIPPELERGHGLSSGTIVRSDGYILCNYHAIAGADSVLVTMSDRRSFSAKVAGYDSLIDIALLKIEAKNLPRVTLGDSDLLKVGDWVLAIGHPLGLGSTLTHGIVSALGRQVQVIDSEFGIESFIQTNAVINPGNSGGPLLNLRGEVVGINTAISTGTGYFIGYGHSVPINLAREAMNDILAYGRVVHGYMGVGMEEVTPELIGRHNLKLNHPLGVYLNVQPHTPAERGGLLSGDVLLSVDGQTVNHANHVQTLIYHKDPGDIIALTVLRDGAERHLELTLGEREEDRLLALGRERISQLGITVEDLGMERARELGFTKEVAAELNLGEYVNPVAVVEVKADSPADREGIQVNDVIAGIDHQRIKSIEHLVHSISTLERGRAALFWLWRPREGIEVRVFRVTE